MSKGRAHKHITLDSSLIERIQKHADAYDLPFSYIVERGMTMYLDMWKLREADNLAEESKKLKGARENAPVQP